MGPKIACRMTELAGVVAHLLELGADVEGKRETGQCIWGTGRPARLRQRMVACDRQTDGLRVVEDRRTDRERCRVEVGTNYVRARVRCAPGSWHRPPCTLH